MNTPTLDRWAQVWRRVTTACENQSAYEGLVSRYSEPQRHYHNLAHIAECLVEFDSARELAKGPVPVELAIWFHDAIYDPNAADNEERSAELAKQSITQTGGTAELGRAVAALDLATKEQARSNPEVRTFSTASQG